MTSTFWRRAGLLGAAASLSLTGCALFRPAPKALPPIAEVLPPPKPALPSPKATFKFEIEPNTDLVGYVQRVEAGKDDTLPDIARRFDVGYEEIVTANPGVDPWLPGEGKEIVVPTQYILPAAPHQGVVVDVAAMRIYYFPPHKKSEPQVLYTHPIGIGRVGWRTPEGTTKIVSRTKDPVWVVPKSVREEHAKDGDKLPSTVPAGPDNPLGQYMFRLQWPSYLIHGTNKPYGVGMRSSHGCMRLYPEDIAVFYDLIPIGTKVTVVNQPYLFGWRDGTLYMQAYEVMTDDARNWDKERHKLLTKLVQPKMRERGAGHGAEIDWQRVHDLAHAPRAVPIAVSGAAEDVDAVVARSLLVENRLPEGSNWDGKSGLLVDEQTFNDLVNSRDKTPPTTNAAPGPSSAAVR